MITKSHLTKALKKSGLTYQDASMSIDVLIETIIDTLSMGQSLQLRGLGTFSVKKQAERKASLNGHITVPEHGRVVFRPSEQLKKAAWDCFKKAKK